MMRRRTVIKGMAGLPLAAVLADPLLARAVAQERTREVSVTTPGGRKVGGALARPAETPAPALLLVHEWWGLNDQIRAVTAEFAQQGYLALAVDLFGGRVTDDPQQARRQTQQVDPEQAVDTLTAWVEWLRGHDDSTGQVATVGWCFGGGWALRAATHAPVDAVVVYYGRVNLPAEQLSNLQGPVLGHFGRQDRNIDAAMVEEFERNMDAAGRRYVVNWYDADHAFANPTGDNYDREDTQQAWQRTLEFLERTLG